MRMIPKSPALDEVRRLSPRGGPCGCGCFGAFVCAWVGMEVGVRMGGAVEKSCDPLQGPCRLTQALNGA